MHLKVGLTSWKAKKEEGDAGLRPSVCNSTSEYMLLASLNTKPNPPASRPNKQTQPAKAAFVRRSIAEAKGAIKTLAKAKLARAKKAAPAAGPEVIDLDSDVEIVSPSAPPAILKRPAAPSPAPALAKGKGNKAKGKGNKGKGGFKCSKRKRLYSAAYHRAATVQCNLLGCKRFKMPQAAIDKCKEKGLAAVAHLE